MSDPISSIVREPARIPGGEWFTGAGLGIFVHWDHASQQGIEISWPLVGRSIIPGVDQPEDPVTVDEYQSSAPAFNPTQWDATALARAAKDAGATYVVFTTRHHAGYSMFHTKHSGFGVEHGPFGRDIVREYADAVRAEGLRVGFYYSLSDWHHPDYPAFTDADRPYPAEHWPAAGRPENAGTPIAADRHRRSTPEQWARYLDYLRGQLTELLTNYGTVDLLWFDGEWERSPAEWDAAGLRELIKSLQPDVVINERLPENGDYRTPEQAFPLTAPDGPWELCLTIGQMWGYRPTDTKNKSARSLAVSLVEVVSRGGNLLLNVGPRGDGSLVEAQLDRLKDIGGWLATHAEAVVGVTPTTGVDFYGPTTARDGVVYLHLVNRPVEEIVVRGLPVRRIANVRLVGTGAALPYEVAFEVHEVSGDDAAEPLGEVRIAAPEPTGALIDVVAVEFE